MYAKLLLAIVIIVISYNPSKKDKPEKTESKKWWKEGILYQIYPQSFKDSDGDGIGDFRGISEKLDYLQSLGINMVWMNPFFDSPLIDNGYDVSNYRKILPRYGTMADFETMLEGFHKRGIKFVLDVVVNHSSDQHEWFIGASSSREHPYHKYYHWWYAEKGTPPHRHSLFDPTGGWKYVKEVNAYYLHTFAKEQPDLNWENPKLRQEVYAIMKFWAEKGVDGFRMDAFQFASKDTTYPTFPDGHEKEFIKWYGLRPQLHDYLKEMNKEVISEYDVFAVAEGSGSSFQDAHDLVDEDRKELQVAYHFECVDMDRTLDGYTLGEFKEKFSRWDSAFSLKGWMAIFLANHDNARLVSRFGNPSPEFRIRSTQMLNTFLLSLRGTPYTYYGDEIGMTNIDMPKIEQYEDIEALGKYRAALEKGEDMNKFMELLNYNSRENSRTPMQWNSSTKGGFTTGTPWKIVNPNYTEINVEAEETNSEGILHHYRKMTKLRTSNQVLIYGKYTIIQKEHPHIYAYTREDEKEKVLVLLNFSKDKQYIDLPNQIDTNQILINNYKNLNKTGKRVGLEGYQAVIVKQ